MTPLLSRSTVALWLLTIKTVSAACSILSPAPVGLTCGVFGYFTLFPDNYIIENLYSPEELDPVGCAAACAHHSDCAGFALGPGTFCQPERLTPAELGFEGDPGSSYEFFEPGCFACLPDVVSSTALSFSTSEEPTSTLMLFDSTSTFDSPQTSSTEIGSSITPEASTEYSELPTSTVEDLCQTSTDLDSTTIYTISTTSVDIDTVAETATEFSTGNLPATSTTDESTVPITDSTISATTSTPSSTPSSDSYKIFLNFESGLVKRQTQQYLTLSNTGVLSLTNDCEEASDVSLTTDGGLASGGFIASGESADISQLGYGPLLFTTPQLAGDIRANFSSGGSGNLLWANPSFNVNPATFCLSGSTIISIYSASTSDLANCVPVSLVLISVELACPVLPPTTTSRRSSSTTTEPFPPQSSTTIIGIQINIIISISVTMIEINNQLRPTTYTSTITETTDLCAYPESITSVMYIDQDHKPFSDVVVVECGLCEVEGAVVGEITAIQTIYDCPGSLLPVAQATPPAVVYGCATCVPITTAIQQPYKPDINIPAKASSSTNGNAADAAKSNPTSPAQFSSNAVSNLREFLLLGAIAAITFLICQ